ncbi:immunoglobulin superfamily member 5-like isoform X3 [Arapaima gigas]
MWTKSQMCSGGQDGGGTTTWVLWEGPDKGDSSRLQLAVKWAVVGSRPDRADWCCVEINGTAMGMSAFRCVCVSSSGFHLDMTQPILCCLLLLQAAKGALAQVDLKPTSAAVLAGTNTTFLCSLQQPWVVMSWLLNGNVVLTITWQHGPVINDHRYMAQNKSTAQTSSWGFTIVGVRQSDAGSVTCDVQNIQKQTALLDVQEKGTVAILGGNVTATQGDLAYFQCQALGWLPEPSVTWTVEGQEVDQKDYNITSRPWWNLFNTTSVLNVGANHNAEVTCRARVSALPVPLNSTVFMSVVAPPSRRNQTILIAVTVSLAVFVLLVLIAIGLIFFCKRKKAKKSTYEEEVRKTKFHSKEHPKCVAKQGTDNLGYATYNCSGVTHSQFDDSGFSQPSVVSTLQQTPSSIHAATSPGLVCTHHSAMKYRHATIV